MTQSEHIGQLQKAVMQLQVGAIYNQALIIQLMEYVIKLDCRIFGDPLRAAGEDANDEARLQAEAKRQKAERMAEGRLA